MVVEKRIVFVFDTFVLAHSIADRSEPTVNRSAAVLTW